MTIYSEAVQCWFNEATPSVSEGTSGDGKTYPDAQEKLQNRRRITNHLALMNELEKSENGTDQTLATSLK